MGVLAGCSGPQDYSALEFRPVLLTDSVSSGSLQTQAGSPDEVDLAAQLAALDCTQPTDVTLGSDAGGDDDLLACDLTGAERFALGPTELDGLMVDSVSVGEVTNQSGATTGQYEIQIELSAEGSDALTDVTSRIRALAAPQNRLALVSHGQVISAPTVMAAITEGQLSITGGFTESEARDIVAQFGAATD